jgi:hypothetical protein
MVSSCSGNGEEGRGKGLTTKAGKEKVDGEGEGELLEYYDALASPLPVTL